MPDTSIQIHPVQSLDVAISAPSSKAHSLRYIFIAALADGASRLDHLLLGEDQHHAINAIRSLGIPVELDEAAGTAVIHGAGGQLHAPDNEIFIGNSGVGIRFLTPIAALVSGGNVTLTGDERMCSGRPIADLLTALAPLGITASSMRGNGMPPLIVQGGGIRGGTTHLRGQASSQYFSAILIAAPFADEDVTIHADGEIKSRPYIDTTIAAMQAFGVKTEVDTNSFRVTAGQRYQPLQTAIEGDYSSASYFFAAAAVTGGKVRVNGLRPDSDQGDRYIVEALQRMNCHAEFTEDAVELQGRPLKPIETDMSNYPDLVPTLAVVAAFADGTSVFTGVEHLRIKESDRLAATAAELQRLGVDAEDAGDRLIVRGCAGESMQGATIETYNDHRLAMAFAIAGLRVPGVVISNPGCVAKSFPDFFERLADITAQDRS
ncbi:MAG: 3-phosphoshikimate 1-carboxyvinyltransferase [Lentisphaeria bacterium]